MTRFCRYVALGDSSTEGLDDPDGAGGYRGWADRLAEHVAKTSPGLRYANLAVRGKLAREIAGTQLATAIAMQPDLATVVAGMNDLFRRDFTAVDVAGHIDEMVRGLVASGATVITFTLPDVSRRMRLGARLSARTQALNAEIRRSTATNGAVLLDLASSDLAADPRMWAIDRIHGNPTGHARIADELGYLLDLPDAISGLTRPLEPLPPRRRRDMLREDLRWIAQFATPFLWRRFRGRTLGDGREPKRPILTPLAK